MKNGRGQGSGIQAHVSEDMRHLQQMSRVRFAGAAKLVAVPLGGDFVGAAHHPGIFGGTILAQLGQQLVETRVELALGAVSVEVQRYVAGRRHILVYARRGLRDERGGSGRMKNGRGVQSAKTLSR